MKLNQIKGHAEMKMDSKWNEYAESSFKSLLLKQTKQEAIVLASSKLIKARIHLARRNVLSEVSTTTTSQSRTPLKQASQKRPKTLISFISFFILGFSSSLAITKPQNCSSSYTAKDHNVTPYCPSHSGCYISNLSKHTWMIIA